MLEMTTDRRRIASNGVGASLSAAVVAFLIVTSIPAAAAAYVRSHSAGGLPYRWEPTCIPIEVHLSGLSGATDAELRAAAEGAARVWTADGNACTGLQIALSFLADVGPAAENDGDNVIGARTDGWCPASASTAPPPAVCNPPSALAATSVFAEASGRIVGGDTQLNTINVSWGVLDDQGQPAGRQDLQAALTHEIGHLLGLEHPCWNGAGPQANDDRGQPVPSCYGSPAELQQDTMFPTIDPGDFSKRWLSPDAQRAVCEIYPASAGPSAPPIAGTPRACPASDVGGCTLGTAGGEKPNLLALSTVAVALLAINRRRQRQRMGRPL